jgi:hypothetical protein
VKPEQHIQLVVRISSVSFVSYVCKLFELVNNRNAINCQSKVESKRLKFQNKLRRFTKIRCKNEL